MTKFHHNRVTTTVYIYILYNKNKSEIRHKKALMPKIDVQIFSQHITTTQRKYK